MTPTPEQTRKCSNCMWWKRDGGESCVVGLCFGAPPVRSTCGGAGRAVTHASDWCGSFRMKEPGQ